MIRTLALVLLLAFAGCSGTRDSRRPDAFQLSLSKGGGFTGSHLGYDVFGDGRVEKWRGIVRPDSAQVIGVLEPAVLDSLWELIDAARPFNEADRRAGNITARLRLVLPDSTAEVSWPSTLGPVPSEEPLETVYQNLIALLSRHVDL